MDIQPAATASRSEQIRARAAGLETAFLSQMLAHAGFDRALSGMGGGAGGDQFASFLREEQAQAIVRAGGIGLTEPFFRALGGQDG
jgi:flagellar protein FlgJ